MGHFSHMYATAPAGWGWTSRSCRPSGVGGCRSTRSQALAADPNREIKAVLVVHNETSTGVTSSIAAVRRALDDADHPALLLVDAVSSLASIEFEFDAWRVDVA